ncbi:MAG TPA: hypothetical protein VGM90_05630 [Kofleriaceae bacterium]|jgi:hypothetical protein
MRSVLALLLVTAAACQGNKTAPPATGSGSAPAVKKVEPTATAPMGDKLTLPKDDGTPPKKSDKALDPTIGDRLIKLDYPGFEKQDRTNASAFEVRFLTTRPRLAITVTITPCQACTPMELEQWQPKKAGLQSQLLAEELRSLPDTKWEIEKVDLNGTPAIATYQFGMLDGKDDQGQPQGAYSDAYAIYFNDGVNQIRVVAEYKDDWVARNDMLAIAPKEDLAKLARAFTLAYTHAW